MSTEISIQQITSKLQRNREHLDVVFVGVINSATVQF